MTTAMGVSTTTSYECQIIMHVLPAFHSDLTCFYEAITPARKLGNIMLHKNVICHGIQVA